jgi:hypothetical protein
MKCWLCEFSDDTIAKRLNQYAADQISCMDVETIANAIHEQLVEACPMSDGIGSDEVLAHFTHHTIAPNIRVAMELRALLQLSGKLRDVTTTTDEETGLTVVDAKNVTAYRQVVQDIMNIYKLGDASKLMFANK